MEIAIHHLANALFDIGCKVTVIAKNNKNKGQFEHRYNLARYGYSFRGSGRSGADFASSFLTLMKEYQKRHFDVINCHGVSYAGSRTVFAKKIIRAPIVMTPHGRDIQKVPELGYGLRLKKRWDAIIKRNLLQAEAIIAISDAIKKELCFVPDDKIYVIPNGIDRKQFSARQNHFLHDLLSINLDTKIVLSVGLNRKVKGYEYGIRAFDALNKMTVRSDMVYVIIGKDTHILEPLVHKLSLEKKVFLLPQHDRETIVKCYQSAWCFFSPSIIEGLSLVSIEAMAAGLPLLVTDVPGNMDIVRDNQCGLIVRTKDPVSMAQGIKTLVSDHNLYNSLSEKALERVQLYDWQKIAKRYLEIYRIAVERYKEAIS